jgi:LPXTG-motif cell wall-anchored protein
MDSCTAAYGSANCTLPQTGFDWLGYVIAIALMLVFVGAAIHTNRAAR